MIFSSPIKIFINQQKDPLLFHTSDEFVSWVDKQSRDWTEFTSVVRPASDLIPIASSYIAQNSSHWVNHHSTIVSYANNNDEPSLKSMESSLQSLFQQNQILWSGDVIPSRAIAVADYDKTSAVWLYLLASGHSGQILMGHGTVQNWSSFANCLILLIDAKSTASFHNRHRAVIRSVEKAISESNSKLQEISSAVNKANDDINNFNTKSLSEFENLKTDLLVAAESQRNDFNGDWNKLRSSYDSQLKLSAPRIYWNSKYNDHQAAAKAWARLFFLMILVAAGIMILALKSFALEWIKIPDSMSSYEWVVPAVVIGIPAFLSLWLLRMFGRQWSEHLVRKEDARERVVMIETFLALNRDADSPSAINDPAQLALVLSSIFRPASNGSNDDSPPAGFFEAILSKISNQK